MVININDPMSISFVFYYINLQKSEKQGILVYDRKFGYRYINNIVKL